MAVRHAEEGMFKEFEDPETGERIVVSVSDLFGRMWDDYIRGMIPNDYARGMLREMELVETDVFHMMERLQMGKAEWDENNYHGGMYI